MVLVHYQRGGLDADFQFFYHLIRFGIDLDDAVLVRPAVAIDIFAILHHLLRGAAFHRHVRHLDVTGDFIFLGVDDEDAVVPQLGDIGFLVAEEMDIARRSQVRDTAHLFERIEVDGENHVGIVHHDPALIVVDAHRLRHVAQLHAVGTEEDFVLHLFGCRVVIGQGSIAVLEVALVGDEQPGSGSVEIFHRISVVPLHAARQQQRQPA